MAIVDWEYYSSLYSKISEAEFEKAEKLAENEVKTVVGKFRWEEIDEETFGFSELKDCICKVINIMADNKKNEQYIGISNISNDGYSVSFGGTITEGSLKSQLQSNIKSMLSGTGLVGAY